LILPVLHVAPPFEVKPNPAWRKFDAMVSNCRQPITMRL
jgi:hypothetical protein